MISARLVRYGVAGGFSLLSHLLVLLALVELAGWNPVLSSVLGFCLSVVVSFSLQHFWVFEHGLRMRVTFPRFLLVTLFGLALNATIMALGTSVFGWHYLPIQLIAFAAIPISNYLLNRAWTFHDSPPVIVRDQAPRPGWHLPALLLMSLATVALAPFAALHLDLARDLLVAHEIVANQVHLMLGPPLAGLFNLGPIWYYLLALFQALGAGVAGSVALLLLLASTRFWLVYRAGELWQGRSTGLIWAALLLIPSWTSLELFLVQHPVLTTTLMAMVMLFGLRFVRTGRSLDLALIGLSFSLALHAHPSTLVMGLLPLGFVVLGWIEHGPRWSGLAVAGLLALLPFAPMLIDLHQSGWPLLENLQAYNAARQDAALLASLMALTWALTGGGLHYWLDQIVSAPALVAWVASLTLLTVCLLGLAGSVKRAVAGDRIALLLLISLLSGLIGLALIRDVHPYYMLAPVHVVLCGLVAGGLTAWSPIALSRQAMPATVCALALIAWLPSAFALVSHQRAGSWPFALLPLFDVKAKALEHAPHPFLSAAGTRRSGRWLCRHPGVNIHGPYALSLLHSYGIEARLACGAADIHLGAPNSASDNRPALVGLTASFLAQTQRDGLASAGLYELLPIQQVLGQAEPIALAELRRYPPLPPDFETATLQRLPLADFGGQYLLLTNLGFALGPTPLPELQCQSETVEPLARDNISWLWRVPDCPEVAMLEIDLANPSRLDIVVF